ncbi:MAG: OmpH family outer membrane protein [Planctomycetes bacterium]|nr:OmpH family outer membrane protein [Planctomycetota bacterium]
MRTYLPLSLVLLGIVAFAALAQDKPQPTKSGIVVLNMMRTIDESDEGKDIINKLKEEQASKKQSLTDQLAKLQEKVKILREAKPADRTPEYYQELEKAMETSARLEMEKNIFLARKQDELNRAMQQLLILAQQTAREVMKERGAEVVLLTKMGPIELATDQDVQQELVMRRVLCHEDSLDISQAVIDRMNKWYKENKRN